MGGLMCSSRLLDFGFQQTGLISFLSDALSESAGLAENFLE